jgi:superfamily II DNA/RNA helicase
LALPGRVMIIFTAGPLKCDQVKMIILDEADEMLDMGFKG